MILIVDTNILLAGLIKDSKVRKIIVESEWEFYYPESSFHEVRKYKDLVIEKSGMNEKEYNKLLSCFLKYIKLVSEEQIKEKIQEADKILRDIDPDDVIFLAAALSIENSKIWSDDSHLKEQKKVLVFNTKDLIRLFFPEQ